MLAEALNKGVALARCNEDDGCQFVKDVVMEYALSTRSCMESPTLARYSRDITNQQLNETAGGSYHNFLTNILFMILPKIR